MNGDRPHSIGSGFVLPLSSGLSLIHNKLKWLQVFILTKKELISLISCLRPTNSTGGVLVKTCSHTSRYD